MPTSIVCRFSFVLCLACFLQCTQSSRSSDVTDNGCPNGVCKELQVSDYEPRSPASWEVDAPEFSGLFQLVDVRNRPIKGATLRIQDRVAKTDEKGDAPFDKLSAIESSVVQVEHSDYLASAFKANYTTSGVQKLTVTMLRKPVPVTVDTNEPVTLSDGDASWKFAEQPFQDLNGKRISGPVQVKMLTLGADSVPRSAIPGDRVAETEDGRTTLIREELSLIMTEVKDMAGESVEFAPGVAAQLSVLLPETMADRLPAGKRLGLYSLDPARAKWVRESSCEVQSLEGTDSSRRCVGSVEHFSYWLVADEFDVYTPDTFGCVNMVIDTSDIGELLEPRPGSPKPWVAYQPLRRCDDEGKCPRDLTFYYGQGGVLRPTAERPHGSLCGVTEAGEGYRLEASIIRAGQSSFMLKHDFVLASLKDATGSEDLLNQMLDPERDCPTLCQQVVVKPSLEDLVAGLSDEDRDGFFAVEDPEVASTEQLRGLDCDDQAPATYPGAYESWCEPIDRNCDGSKPKEDARYRPGNASWPCSNVPQGVTDKVPACYRMWNRLCDLACFERTEEKPGNRYDEDCDGVVIDADGDGYYSRWDTARQAAVIAELGLEDDVKPGDCNDYHSAMYPGALEVPGNPIDEDCDGIALDYDGDGYYAHGHEIAVHALEMKLEDLRPPMDGGMPDGGLVTGEVQVDLDLKFGDCDDYDRSVNPGVSVQEEAGALAHMYTPDGLRTALFCDYFTADGNPSRLFQRQVRDRNCDGRITDVDGDGFTIPGDDSLGPERAFDCNDYDARLIDECGTTFEANLKNESECEPLSGDDGNTGLAVACPLLASRIQTTCTEVTTEINMCLYPGWDTANPLRLTPGVLWGPCDGQERVLPDCPVGAACGTPVPYSEELLSYLKEAYTEGADLEFQGICFRTCEEPE